jgi:hypothetical protein
MIIAAKVPSNKTLGEYYHHDGSPTKSSEEVVLHKI